MHRRLEERADSGARLLTESGPMLKLQVDAQWVLAGGGALRGQGELAAGRLDYEGRTQAGVPLATDSSHRDLALALAWRPLAPAGWGEGWLALRLLQQRRQIASTAAASGLRETSLLVLPGLRWNAGFAAGNWRLEPSVELRVSLDHGLRIDYGGLFDDSDIEGATRREVVLGLAARPADSPWSFSLEWLHASQSASDRQSLYRNGVQVGNVRQPALRIDDFSLLARRAF